MITAWISGVCGCGVLILTSWVLMAQDLKLSDEALEEKSTVEIPEGRSRLMDPAEFKKMADVPTPTPTIVLQKMSAPDFERRLKKLMNRIGKKMKKAQQKAIEKEIRDTFKDFVGETQILTDQKVTPSATPTPVVTPEPAKPSKKIPSKSTKKKVKTQSEVSKDTKAIQTRIEEINRKIEDPKLPWAEFEKLLNERKDLEKALKK